MAGQCVVFKVLSSYLNYHTLTMCGIPEIFLKGTPYDWEMLRKKVELLRGEGVEFELREGRKKRWFQTPSRAKFDGYLYRFTKEDVRFALDTAAGKVGEFYDEVRKKK